MQRYDVLAVVNGRSETFRYHADSPRHAAVKLRRQHRSARILSIVNASSGCTGRRPVVRHGANK